MTIRIAVTTLGCKTNHYDSAALIGRLDHSVFVEVPFSEEADIYIVNSCTVTALADRQSRQFIYQARRRNPAATIILAGCYATTAEEQMSKKKEIDFIVSRNGEKTLFDVVCEQALKLGYSPVEEEKAVQFGSQSRPYLKIQDGCEAFCSYCIIPYARGPVKSVPVEKVLKELESLSDRGYREVVLTGIHVGQWGKDIYGKPSFYTLLEAIDKSGLIGRVRVSSLEPMELSDEIIGLIAESKVFCPHLHIPLQSGSDKILKLMKRPYLTRHYKDRLLKAVDKIDHVGIGIDVIVGFPEESEKDFLDTVQFIESLPYQYLHVFPYSQRPNTPAALMDGQVSVEERKRRARHLIEIGKNRLRQMAQKQVGSVRSVLVENKPDKKSGLFKGFSENYHEILIESEEDLSNKVVEVKPLKLYKNSARLLAKCNEE